MSKVWRERILRLTICGMEMAALYVFLSLATFKATDNAVSVPALLSPYLVSFVFNRVFFNFNLNRTATILLNALVWLVGIHIAIKLQLFPALPFFDADFIYTIPRAFAAIPSGVRPELFMFIMSLLIWPLGYRLARIRIGFVISLAEFQCGLFIILVTYMINAQISASFLNSPFIALIFVALAIFAMAVSHAEQASSWLGGRHATFWMSVLILTIGLIALVGVFAGAFATHDFLDLLLTPLRWAWWAFSQFMLFLAEHTLMENVLNPLDWGAGNQSAENPDVIWQSFGYPEWVRDTLRVAIGIVWLVFIVFALWSISSLIFHWLRSHFISRSSAEVESLHGAFWDDVRALLGYIRRWLAGLFHPGAGERLAPEAASVRHIYRELLSWGASKGVRRYPEQTPYEYLRTLSEAVPLASGDLQLITDHYVNTRYGLLPPGSDDLANLRATWQRVKRNGYSNH